MNTTVRLAKAYHFAATRHVDQRRKGAAAEPYVNHLTEVAQLLAEADPDGDPDVLIAGVLHDTVEDTQTTLEELEALFGASVSDLVREVTDDKSLAKAERKRLQIEHAAHASRGAQRIKLADKTANLLALASSPPADWDRVRKVEYVRWAQAVVAGCRGADPALESRFDEAAAQLLDQPLLGAA